ncbi:MAG: hypothetical protein ABR923_17620 [Terracidiphilus sp.]|jgi:hypothetical protein
MRLRVSFLAVCTFFLAAGLAGACAQTPSQPSPSPQPLNASVSDYGTTFIFSPPPICPRCVETELGFQSVSDGRYIPAVVTVAPFNSKTDFSVLVNMLDSESAGNDRFTHFGNRFDFVARQQVLAKGIFTLVLAPRGTVFVRGVDGGRAGATAAPQISWGNNLAAANFTWTGGVGVSARNPRSDYVGSFDYYRTLDKKGTAVFLGFQHEVTAGLQTAGTEEGLVIPFRNGQVELETAQLDLNEKPEWQFQARMIVNWGAVFSRK